MRFLVSIAAGFFLFAFAAVAQTPQPVYGPSTLLAVSADNAKVYVPIGYDGMISQYSTPQILTKLNDKNQGANGSTSVELASDGSVHLALDGALLPCSKVYTPTYTAVQEDDLYFSPSKILIPNVVVSTLTHAYVSGTITAVGYPLKKPTSCLSQATATLKTFDATAIAETIILNNPTKNQVLFYQIKFTLAPPAGGATPYNQPPWWFMTGVNKQAQSTAQVQFGYQDYAWYTYKLAPLVSRTPTPFNFDVLPGLKAALAGGAQYGMDPNPADWTVGISNYSVAIWGKYYGALAMQGGLLSVVFAAP